VNHGSDKKSNTALFKNTIIMIECQNAFVTIHSMSGDIPLIKG